MDKIRQRIKELGYGSNKEVAALAGIEETAFSKALSGKRKLSADEADRLATVLKTNHVGLPSVRQIPVIGSVSAGDWKEAVLNPKSTIPCPDDDIPNEAFAVEVDGDSMDLLVKDGGVVIIDPTDLDLISKRYYVIRNGDGETTFKQFLSDPARLAPCSTNPRHLTVYPGRDGFAVVGRVIWRLDRM